MTTNLTIGTDRGTELGEEFLVSLQYEEICDWFCIGSASYALSYRVKVREGPGNAKSSVSGNATSSGVSNVTGSGESNVTSSGVSNVTSSVSGNVTSSVSGNVTSSVSGNVTSSRESNVTSSGESNATNAFVGNATSSEDGNTTSSTRTKISHQEMGAASGDIDHSSTNTITTAKIGSIVTLLAVAVAANLL